MPFCAGLAKNIIHTLPTSEVLALSLSPIFMQVEMQMSSMNGEAEERQGQFHPQTGRIPTFPATPRPSKWPLQAAPSRNVAFSPPLPYFGRGISLR
jgi:hypothetical protein